MRLNKKILLVFLAAISSVGIANSASVVGDYNGVFEVSPLGAATYNLPIECPKGVNGMEPSVALTYSSRSRIGIIGLGWSLSAYSMITKVCATPYYDSKYLPVNYDNVADYLELDGQRLIKYKSISSTEVEFRTEYDKFNRIIRKGSNGDYSFVVYTPEGRTMIYKQHPEGSSYYKGNLGWHLTEVSDMYGNYMTYEYDVACVNGNYNTTSVRLNSISYGGNKTTGKGHTCTVEFLYNDYLYQPLEYVVGGYTKNHYAILSEVRTYTNNSTSNINSRYKLVYTYDAQNRRILSKVTRYGNNGDYLQDLQISWNPISETLKESTQSNVNTQPVNSKLQNQTWFCADYNGDGNQDLLSYSQSSSYPNYSSKQLCVRYYKNTGKGNFVFEKNDELVVPVQCVFSGPMSGRYINCNREDIIMPCLFASTSFVLFANDLKTGVSIPLKTVHYAMPLYACADLNGDGYSDMVVVERNPKDGITYYHIVYGKECSSLSKLEVKKDNYIIHKGNFHKINISDMNGDGIPDIVLISDQGTFVLKNNGSGGLQLISNTSLTYNPDKDPIFEHGDFNGDGICDYYKNGFLYLGSADFKFREFPHGISLMSSDRAISCDIDGDGKSEIALFRQNGKNVQWYRYNGTNFLLFQNSTNDSRTININEIALGDVDLDGRVEVLSLGKSLIGTGIASNCIYTTRLSTDPKGGLVSKISSPFKEIEITYDNLTNSSIYEGGNTYYGLSSVLTLRKSPLYVVSSYKETPKNGKYKQRRYKYESAYNQFTGKGFLGFGRIYSTDWWSDIVTTDIYLLSGANLYHAQRIKEYDSEVINKEVSSYTFERFGTNSRGYSQLINKKTDEDILNGRKVVTTFAQHRFGIPSIVTVDKGAGVKVMTEYKDFELNSTYNTFLPQTVITTKSNTAGSISTTKKISYNTKLKPISEIEFYNTDKELIADYSYTREGNVRNKTIYAFEGEPKYYTYSYTPSGRFLTSIYNNGETLNETIDEVYGRKTKSEIIVGGSSKTITYNTYDGFNNCLKMTFSDGRIRTVSYKYDNSYNPGCYIYSESITGSPTKNCLYDADGKLIRTSMVCADGRTRYQFKSYNEQGQPLTDYKPTLSNYPFGNMYYSSKDYDEYGRLNNEYTDEGRASYSYAKDGNTSSITITTSRGTKVLTYNLAGQLVSSNENGKTVSFSYNPAGLVASSSLLSDTKNLVTRMTYDIAGNRISLDDPDYGVVNYDYDSYGRLVSKTDRGKSFYYHYDKYGRLMEEGDGESNNVYTYYANNLLQKVTGKDYTKTFEYDGYDRLKQQTVKAVDATFTTKYGYANNYGKVSTITYPSGIVATNTYDSNGYHIKTECAGKTIWSFNNLDEYGRLTKETLPGSVVHTYSYRTDNLINVERAYKDTIGLVDLSYKYSNAYTNANLIKKTDNLTGNSESYSYDSMYRLSNVSATKGTSSLQGTHSYDELGNMTKTWDSYWKNITYGGSVPPHQVASVSYTNSSVTNPSVIKFDSYRMVTQIDKGSYSYKIDYDNSHRRIKSRLYKNGSLQYSTYYLGSYEKVVYLNKTREIHYLHGADGRLAGIYVRCGGKDTLFAAVTDRQNSLTAVMDAATNKVEKFSYKPWGMRRNPNNWSENVSTDYISRFNRGYCLHEHIPYMGMINMNGRIYNEQTYQFLSADTYRQDPTSWLNGNRFSYCRNNPVMRTDPSGFQDKFVPEPNAWYDVFGYKHYYSFSLGYKTEVNYYIPVGYSMLKGVAGSSPVYNQSYNPENYNYSAQTNNYLNNTVSSIAQSTPNVTKAQSTPNVTNYSDQKNTWSIAYYETASLGAGYGGTFTNEIGIMSRGGNGELFEATTYGAGGTTPSFSSSCGIEFGIYLGDGIPTVDSYGGLGSSWSLGFSIFDIGYSESMDGNWRTINLGFSFGSDSEIPVDVSYNVINTVIKTPKNPDDVQRFLQKLLPPTPFGQKYLPSYY